MYNEQQISCMYVDDNTGDKYEAKGRRERQGDREENDQDITI